MVISSEDWLHTLQLGDSNLGGLDILDSNLDQKGKLFRCVGENKGDVRWVVPKGARWRLYQINLRSSSSYYESAGFSYTAH